MLLKGAPGEWNKKQNTDVFFQDNPFENARKVQTGQE